MKSQNAYSSISTEGSIHAARIHTYNSPLLMDDIKKPVVSSPEEVVVKVGAAGLCHSDLHLIDGDWKKSIPLKLPKTPGHEIAGWVEEAGSLSNENDIKKGNLVAVFGGWGCGYCVYCKKGDEQMCIKPKWPGLSEYDGGFAQYLLVPSYRYLLKVDKDAGLKPEEVAPLTDAGLTPYRAIKKIRHLLGPGKSIGIIGIGGLGSYAVQYARILGCGAKIIALDRSDDKLALSKDMGADFTVKIQESLDVRNEIERITNGNGIDVVLDTVGLETTIELALRVLNKSGAIVLIGLFGQKVIMPLFQTIIKEYELYGSLWGNYNELREVLELAKMRKIKHRTQKFAFSKVNDAIDLLRNGKVTGRAVITP